MKAATTQHRASILTENAKLARRAGAPDKVTMYKWRCEKCRAKNASAVYGCEKCDNPKCPLNDVCRECGALMPWIAPI